jgi:hypothetical protein
MIAIIPKKNVRSHDLVILPKFSNLSISQIKQASINSSPIKTFDVFEGSWETERVRLAEMTKMYIKNQNLPYQIVLIEDSKIVEILSPTGLQNKLKYLRNIELENQRNSDIENGFISKPSEFKPHDEDWTL